MPFRRRRVAKKAVRKGSKLNLRQKRQVKILMSRRMETKYFPIYVSGTGAGLSGTVIDLTAIPQGDTGATRDGNAVYVKQLKMRALFSAVDSPTNFIRLIIIQWHGDDNDYVPTVPDILQDTVNVPYLSPISYFSKNFTVLRDLGVDINLTTQSVAYRDINIYGKKLSKKVGFSAANKGTNHIYAILISDSGAAPNPTLTFNGYVKYNDC